MADVFEYKLTIEFAADKNKEAFEEELEELLERYCAEFSFKSPTPCLTCARYAKQGEGPSHNGSPRCQSGSIASGGTKSHCSCDTCF
jgi:hypothetical protein